jgi:protein-S-isoprenylcysteine O-methyltransferase Ste14
MRNVLAAIVGFIVASVTVYLFESILGPVLFPLPEGAQPMDMEWLQNNMDKIPIGAKVFVVIAHFAGIVAGMLVAALIPKTSMIPSYIVGGLMLAATFFNIVMLPKELWFTLSDGIFAIVGFLIGKQLGSKKINQDSN